jgi:hypothetical protein
MIHRAVRLSLFIAVCVTFLLPLAEACGPDFTGPILVSVTGPDSTDYSNYVRGDLGILQPTYWHQPLYIAYRNLTGQSFTATERKALIEPSEKEAPSAKDWVAAWMDARKKIDARASNVFMFNTGHGITRQFGQSDTFIQYYNCLDGAFENAVNTLNKRVGKFGAQSPVIKDWIAAQDQVFQNCSGDPGYPPKPKPAVIPSAARLEDPAEIRADRAYQIAAAHFYANDFATAQSDFEAIANDSASPYNKLAPYLVARLLIRKGTLYIGDGAEGKRSLEQAETQLRKILADKNLAEMHRAATRLLGFVNIRLHREQRFCELERSLSRPSNAITFHQDLTDYLWLLDRNIFTDRTATESAAAQPANAVGRGEASIEGSPLKSGDMTDWILTFQQPGDAAFQHSLQRWQQTNSLPWLVVAIAKAGFNDKFAGDLSAAAAKISPDSPAYVTVAFHRLRLLAQSNPEEARNQLDPILSQHKLSRSVNNQFLALRMKLATNLDDFLRFVPRNSNDAAVYPNPPVVDGKTAPENAHHFDVDGSVSLTEKLPLRMLADAAQSKTMPTELQREVAVAGWTRAILLDQEATARQLVPVVTELVPEVAADLGEYLRIMDAPAARFAAVLAILRNPGFRPFVTAGYTRGNLYTVGEPRFDRIDNLHDNWWCSASPVTDENRFYGQDYYRMFIHLSSPLQALYPEGKISSPAFLSSEERATAAKERAELESQTAAPNWLGKRALDYANAHPDDPRVPEALHLVVRARRYGCYDSTSENYSKPAFTLLHKRYPDNPWTKKTPYWFD